VKFLDEANAIGQGVVTLLQQGRRRKTAVSLANVLESAAEVESQANTTGNFKLHIGADTARPDVMMVCSGGAARKRKLDEANFGRESHIVRR